MYDDIANNVANPTPGIIINHPDGDDVYHGVPKDYTGIDVTTENFINVLTGNADAMKGIGTGRVLKSGPNDNVFLNFVDHGATGILAFPSDVISVQQLETTLKTMHTQNQYAKLTFYVEACEAGSMFKNSLPDDINIYVTTASNWNESSYACYYDIKRETYLGDLYSVNWMEDSDAENLGSELLQTQFSIVQSLTDLSHVQQYGDLSIANLVVGKFQGEQSTSAIRAKSTEIDKALKVPSYDVPLDIMFQRLSRATNEVIRETIKNGIADMLRKRHDFEMALIRAVAQVSLNDIQLKSWFSDKPKKITKLDCQHNLVHSFSNACYASGKNPYVLKFAYVMANMCESGVDMIKASAIFASACAGMTGVH